MLVSIGEKAEFFCSYQVKFTAITHGIYMFSYGISVLAAISDQHRHRSGACTAVVVAPTDDIESSECSKAAASFVLPTQYNFHQGYIPLCRAFLLVLIFLCWYNEQDLESG